MPPRRMLTKPQIAMLEKRIPEAVAVGQLNIGDQPIEAILESIRQLIKTDVLEPGFTFDQWLEYLRNPGGVQAPEQVTEGPSYTLIEDSFLAPEAGELVPAVPPATDVLGVPVDAEVSVQVQQARAEEVFGPTLAQQATVPALADEAEYASVPTELGETARWLEAYKTTKAKADRLTEILEICKTKITEHLDAEGADTALVDGVEVATWKSSTRTVFKSKEWREANPEEYQKWTSVQPVKTFRLK